MSITETLNNTWTEGQAKDAAFAVRAKLQALADTALDTQGEVARIVATPAFAGVDQVIKDQIAALQAVVDGVVDSVTASHSEFLYWKPGE